jgi:hypothetical protein
MVTLGAAADEALGVEGIQADRRWTVSLTTNDASRLGI